MNALTAFWSALAPFVILLWLFQRLLPLAGRPGLLIAALLAGAATFYPWSGEPLPFWTASLSANFSVVMMLLLLSAILGRAQSRPLLATSAWRAAWWFGAISSVLLYPSAFGAGPHGFDLYALGWPWLWPGSSLLLFGVVGLVAGLLLWRGNAFGWLLVMALAAFACGLQESSNLWDYLMDPVYGVVSLLAVIWLYGLRGLIGRFTRPPRPSAASLPPKSPA
jgi:hypothetical protein